ncbi:hypothetical protein ARMSODRAFT_544633 [Armillaria solidipes]|uniref:Uncharacterized protein n=1 Tax=Armillaria solidipes TaxID=1076256 RepID=A0A2H3BJB9_9AGAR|nr:hypothetical protein ARMSODRAFT_544633 [Armillaria solidipes]
MNGNQGGGRFSVNMLAGQSTRGTHKLHSRMEQNQRQETNAKYCPGNSPPCLQNNNAEIFSPRSD